jgi:hypothetical protein
MQTSAGEGMMTFESHLKTLVGEGKVTVEAMNEFLGKTAKKTQEDQVASTASPKSAPPRPGAKPITPPAAAQTAGSITIHSTSDKPSPLDKTGTGRGFTFGTGGKKTGS